MPKLTVPLTRPQPDCDRMIRILMGEERARRPPLVEYLVDAVVMRPIMTGLVGREWVAPQPGDRASQAAYWDLFVDFWYRMGYDFVRLEIALPFVSNTLIADDPAPASKGKRAWRDLHSGTIGSWEDFEAYAWPSLEAMDFFPLEYVNAHLPDGMGLISCHAGGIYEHLSAIFSYEGLCFALMDQPDLVRAVADRIGELMQGFYRHILGLERLVVVFPGDDMGFRSATLISPEDLKRFTLPWHSRFCAMTHAQGLPYFLHSCGNLDGIMAHLIDEVGIDGKHSFEDAITPVAEFHEQYGDRIAVLGGVDLNVLSGAAPDRVREYVREVLDACAPRGRFAIGSGNSVPSYVPVENYLAMVDAALTY